MTRAKSNPVTEAGKKKSEALKRAYAEGSRQGFQKGNELCKNFSGKKHTEEWKAARSAAMKANNPMKRPDVAKKVSDTIKANGTDDGPNNPNWKGGSRAYRGPGYDRQRPKVLKRDNYTCQRCGITQEAIDKELDVHHKVPYKLGGTNELSNLISLCRRCHNILEPRTANNDTSHRHDTGGRLPCADAANS